MKGIHQQIWNLNIFLEKSKERKIYPLMKQRGGDCIPEYAVRCCIWGESTCPLEPRRKFRLAVSWYDRGIQKEGLAEHTRRNCWFSSISFSEQQAEHYLSPGKRANVFSVDELLKREGNSDFSNWHWYPRFICEAHNLKAHIPPSHPK